MFFGVFLVQSYISTNSYNALLEGLKQTEKISLEVVNVKSLEQQVIDLQRNVLLYRETESQSVVTRIKTITSNADKGIAKLTTYATSNKNAETYLNLINNMQTHLSDYQNHFVEVQQLSTRRAALFNNQSLQYIKNIKVNIESLLNDGENSKISNNYISLFNDIGELEYLNYQYYMSKDASLITHYQDKLSIIEQQLKQLGNSELISVVQKLRIASFQLVQLTRNYTYLVNVVMSGSTNEFFYLAGKLSELVLSDLKESSDRLNTQSEQTIRYNNYLFILGFIILSILVILVLVRLILPIEKLTKIFQSLASNLPITDSLNVNRNDEVGKLYSAAEAFNNKNVLTEQLLSNAQELNQRLFETNERANQATKSKSIFLANMSHEIRTPMNGIVGMLDLLKRTELQEEQKEYVDKVRASGDILMSVINDILDFSKIEAGKLSLENISFSPTEIIENIIDAITIKANEKNLNVHCSFKSEIPDQMIGDPVRLSQILLNLANNAVKFTQHGNIGFTVSNVQISNRQLLSICVSDTGIGIPKNKVEKIFEDFTQAEDDTTRTFGGTGLGLSIAKQLTHLMNGQLSVTSVEGKGSSFTIEIPIQEGTIKGKTVSQQCTKFDQLIVCHLDDDTFFDDTYLTTISQKVIVKNNLSTIQLLTEAYIKQNNGNNKRFAVIFTTKDKLSDTNLHFIKQLSNTLPNIGIITDTEPKKHFNHISSIWPNRVIHQPITPSKLKKLFIEKKGKNQSQTKSNTTKPLPQYNAHILLVEDNAINQAVAGKILKSFGVSFEIAEDGEQAVSKISNSAAYDFIFMDIQMPIMDGYEATRIIRNKGYDELLICGLSANAMRTDIDAGLAAGMNDYITKPLKISAIANILEKHIGHLKIEEIASDNDSQTD